MANKAEKLVAFHGGLNDNTDPKDLAEDELASAIDCTVSRVGRIGILGGEGSALGGLGSSSTPASINPVKDYGMFYFSTDRDKDGAQLSEDWLALYDSADGNMQFYYRDKQATTPAVSTIEDASFVESGKSSTAKPSFYLADGILRYSNGDFSAVTNNRVHQYVDNKLFEKGSVTDHLVTTGDWTTASSNVTNLASVTGLLVGDTVTGVGIPKNTTVLSISASTCVLSNVPTAAGTTAAISFKNLAIVVRQDWVHSDQQLKSFEDMGTITLAIDNSQEEGPDETAIGNVLGKIILSYWTSENGNWNGSFQYAASPIYHQGGVGPLTEFGTTINFYEDKVSYQLHISRSVDSAGESATVHPFVDDRIQGVRVWFRSHGTDKWHKLQDFDMLKGGKFNWETYDGDTHKAYGIFDGSIGDITVGTTNDFTLAGCSFNDASTSVQHPVDTRIKIGMIITGDDGLPTDAEVVALTDTTHVEIHTATVASSGGQVSLDFEPASGANITSFAETTATFTVTNGASGFSGRQGFIRLWGPHNEPVWKNVNSNGSAIALTTATHVVNITTPAEGVREFQAELLDESFAVVAQSTKQKKTISDSGNSPPPDYEDDPRSS